MILDTCILLWMAGNPSRLSSNAKNVLVPDGEFYVSAISAFEIAIKHKKNKLELPMHPWEWFQEATRILKIKELPVSAKIASLSTEVNVSHADPCDRIIIATAIENNLPIVTSDHLIRNCKQVVTIW
ncbi:MAG: type II toxin-antitoxin system VapC family toxin [Deltaproteobacteria bacterium]|nr:type II toxin-antitoxin system VapC family toxin [Deltaproteobacteria bacterium]MBN2673693.1 type II toxin-antitoxin system VapC family toxin [Deltaproteobacteria bacterium]